VNIFDRVLTAYERLVKQYIIKAVQLLPRKEKVKFLAATNKRKQAMWQMHESASTTAAWTNDVAASWVLGAAAVTPQGYMTNTSAGILLQQYSLLLAAAPDLPPNT
jgi:hypothetical protein